MQHRHMQTKAVMMPGGMRNKEKYEGNGWGWASWCMQQL